MFDIVFVRLFVYHLMHICSFNTLSLFITRLEARQKKDGTRKVTAKRPLKMFLYKAIAEEMLKKTDDAGFSHLFLVLSWNLMCCSDTTLSVKLSHLSAEEDCISFFIPQEKDNQLK